MQRLLPDNNDLADFMHPVISDTYDYINELLKQNGEKVFRLDKPPKVKEVNISNEKLILYLSEIVMKQTKKLDELSLEINTLKKMIGNKEV